MSLALPPPVRIVNQPSASPIVALLHRRRQDLTTAGLGIRLILQSHRKKLEQRTSDFLAELAIPRFQTFHREHLSLRSPPNCIALSDTAYEKREEEQDSGVRDLNRKGWSIRNACLKDVGAQSCQTLL